MVLKFKMAYEQFDFGGEKLTKIQEFKIVYSGPTFENGINIDKLIENLKSIKELINSIADINSEMKEGQNSSKEVKEIKVILQKGSIVEQIIISFSNPEIRSYIINFLIAGFFYFIGRNQNRKEINKFKEETLEKIEELALRKQLKNIKKIYNPLENTRDNLKILENDSIKFQIDFSEKEELDKSIKKFQKEIDNKSEESKEIHQGYISYLDFDNKKLKFHPKSMKDAYPLSSKFHLSRLIPLIGKTLITNMVVRKYKNKIRSFHLESYKIVKEDINEYLGEDGNK